MNETNVKKYDEHKTEKYVLVEGMKNRAEYLHRMIITRQFGIPLILKLEHLVDPEKRDIYTKIICDTLIKDGSFESDEVIQKAFEAQKSYDELGLRSTRLDDFPEVIKDDHVIYADVIHSFEKLGIIKKQE